MIRLWSKPRDVFIVISFNFTNNSTQLPAELVVLIKRFFHSQKRAINYYEPVVKQDRAFVIIGACKPKKKTRHAHLSVNAFLLEVYAFIHGKSQALSDYKTFQPFEFENFEIKGFYVNHL